MISQSRARARIGVLVPFTNTNLEADLAMMRPEGVSFHVARLGGYDVDEIPDETQMAGLGASDLDEPLRLIEGVRPQAILYGCTSATLTHGPGFDRDLAARIAARSGAHSITAAGAIVQAARALGVTRIAFASPYVGAINEMAVAFFAQEGLTTVGRADIGRDLGNYGQGELTPREVKALARKAVRSEAEALVLSCTDMRAAEAVVDLESELGLPVICSNQAMLYVALKALGIAPSPVARGRLLGLLA